MRMPFKTIQLCACVIICLFGTNYADTDWNDIDNPCTVTKSFCPGGYSLTYNPSFCLRHVTMQMIWEKARHFCQQDNADLVVINNHKRQDHLRKYFNSLVPKEYWLGLNDRFKEGQWIWEVDGNVQHYETVKANFRDRVFSEFHKRGRSYGAREAIDCSTLSITAGKIYQRHCERIYSEFICETYTLAHKLCPNGIKSRVYFVKMCSRTKNGVRLKQYTSGRSCGKGLLSKSVPRWVCLSVFKEKLTWKQAVEKCQANNSTLLTIDNKFKLKIVLALTEAWIGLNDKSSSGVAKWLDTPANNERRVRVRPNTCVSLKYDGSLKVMHCKEFLPFLCQKESLDGPSKPLIETNFFRRHSNLMFMNEPVEVKCTAMGTEDGKMLWTAFTVKNSRVQPRQLQNVTITQNEGKVRLETGECRNQATSTYRFLQQGLTGTHVSCFSYKYSDETACLTPLMKLQFCNTVVLNMPVDTDVKKPPVLRLAYKGYPGSIVAGDVITATCNVHLGSTGKVFWAIYDKYNNYSADPFKDNGPEITSNLMNDTENGIYGETIFELKVEPYMSGLSVACFAYNAVQWLGPYPTCHEKDMYCRQTQKISVKNEQTEPLKVSKGSTFVWYPLFFLFVLLVFGAAMWKYGEQTKTQGEEHK